MFTHAIILRSANVTVHTHYLPAAEVDAYVATTKRNDPTLEVLVLTGGFLNN